MTYSIFARHEAVFERAHQTTNKRSTYRCPFRFDVRRSIEQDEKYWAAYEEDLLFENYFRDEEVQDPNLWHDEYAAYLDSRAKDAAEGTDSDCFDDDLYAYDYARWQLHEKMEESEAAAFDAWVNRINRHSGSGHSAKRSRQFVNLQNFAKHGRVKRDAHRRTHDERRWKYFNTGGCCVGPRVRRYFERIARRRECLQVRFELKDLSSLAIEEERSVRRFRKEHGHEPGRLYALEDLQLDVVSSPKEPETWRNCRSKRSRRSLRSSYEIKVFYIGAGASAAVML